MWIFLLRKFVEKRQYTTLPPSNNDELRSPDPATLLFQDHPGPTAGLNRGFTLGFHPFHPIGSLEWHEKHHSNYTGGGCGVPWKDLGHNWLVAKKVRYQRNNSDQPPKLCWIPMGSFYSFQHELTGIKKRPRPGYPMSLWPHEEWGPPAASIQQTDSLFDGRTPPFFWKCDAYPAAFPYNPGTNHQIIKHFHQISEALQKKKQFQIQLCVFSKVQRSCNFQHLRVRVFCWTSDPLGHLITGRQLDEGNVHLVRCTVVPTPENKELSCEYAKFMVCFSMIGDLVEGSGWFI